jgi:type II secretory pathway pseudopilin PulG
MDSMGPRTRAGKSGQSGFTLAAVLVIMTIMMIVVAYTVPRMWSTALKREREKQTIFIMQQYAKAIVEFRTKQNGAYPTSLQQLKDARQPRMIRGVKGEFADALTGEIDWLVIPQAAGGSIPLHTQPGGLGQNGTPVTGGPPPPPPPPPPASDSNAASGTPGPTESNATGQPTLPGIPIKDYAGGPFIGVRPGAHGKSFMTLFGADTYETWIYTTIDYDNEKGLRIQAANMVFTRP